MDCTAAAAEPTVSFGIFIDGLVQVQLDPLVPLRSPELVVTKVNGNAWRQTQGAPVNAIPILSPYKTIDLVTIPFRST